MSSSFMTSGGTERPSWLKTQGPALLLTISACAASMSLFAQPRPPVLCIDEPGGCVVAQPGAYPWYPALDTSALPFSASGPWGQAERLQAPAAPSIVREVVVTSAAQFNAAATSGTRVVIGADISETIDVRASDVEVVVPRGRSIAGINLAGYPFTPISRVRIRGSTPGTHSGGLVGKIWALARVDDLIVDGLDLNGRNSSSSGPGQGIQSGNEASSRWAIVNNRGNFRGWAFLGTVRHIVFAGNNFKHAQSSRERNGYVEGWGIRNAGGPIVLFRNRIEGTRYHAIRAQPTPNGRSEYLFAAENTIVSLNEGRVAWIWANLGNGERADGMWFRGNRVYTHVAASCGLGVSLEGLDVDYSRVSGNQFFGAGASTFSDAMLVAQARGYPGDHDWSQGNSFSALGALPAWEGVGDPSTIPLEGNVPADPGTSQCPAP
jgi:hypothetical protein